MKTCSVCRSQNLSPAWTIERYALSRCNRCSHVFVSDGLQAGELEHAYDEVYYKSDDAAEAAGYRDYLAGEAARLRGFSELLRQVEQFAPVRGRLLDYGCAVGLFVKVAADAGWDAMGCERSEWAADYGRNHYGLRIESSAQSVLDSHARSFDVVTMWDVLEHLEDPAAVIASVARLLVPGGLVALNTVDSASLGARLAGPHWRHIAPPHHLQYFTRESLAMLLRSHGFRLLAVRSKGVLWGADKRRSEPRGMLGAAEDVATHWRVRPLAHALHLLDEVEIFARLESAGSAA